MLPRQATIESSLRSFQYKMFINISHLNRKLFKFKIVDSPVCSLCKTESESSLRSFQYKMFINISHLNRKLFKLKIVDSPVCSLCKTESESVLHSFCACAITSNLLEQFSLWVSDISLFDNIDKDPQTIICMDTLRELEAPTLTRSSYNTLLSCIFSSCN